MNRSVCRYCPCPLWLLIHTHSTGTHKIMVQENKGVALGLAFGVTFGVVFDMLAIGISLGLVFGIMYDRKMKAKGGEEG